MCSCCWGCSMTSSSSSYGLLTTGLGTFLPYSSIFCLEFGYLFSYLPLDGSIGLIRSLLLDLTCPENWCIFYCFLFFSSQSSPPMLAPRPPSLVHSLPVFFSRLLLIDDVLVLCLGSIELALFSSSAFLLSSTFYC